MSDDVSTTHAPAPITPAVDATLERTVSDFLFLEAELLDTTRYQDWFDTCVSRDLVYEIPIRTTRERAAGLSEFSRTSFHQRDHWISMKLRVDRLHTEHAWAEDPASRTARMVTNIRVRATDDPAVVDVKSNLMLYRSQWDTISYELLVGERTDQLRNEGGQWKLTRRLVHLAHTSLGTPNLGVFL